MSENDQERTEQASSRKREQAAQEGRTAVSKELASLFVIVSSIVVLYFAGVWIATGSAELMRASFASFNGELTVKSVSDLFSGLSYKFLLLMLPALAVPVIGALSYVLQNGIRFTGKGLTPDFSKIDPLAGAKRLLSLNSAAELVKAVLKISVLTYAVFVTVKDEWTTIPHLLGMDLGASATYMAKVSLRIMTKTIWVVAVIALLDYAYQKWTFEKSLRMSREELKEEAKELEGDPLVKARIRSIQRELARKRMMADVPKADVIVTNPTHLAVAIKYDRAKANAPIVVAKGAGLVAQRIREIGKENGVPVLENKPLARTLFKLVSIGSEIPADVYKAVAEILAYVYRLKNKVRTH